MIRTYVKSAIAGSFALGLATAALAATGEFGNLCAQGLATGQGETDCSIEQIGGKTYCFGSEAARATFMKDPQNASPRRSRPTRSKRPARPSPSRSAREASQGPAP